MQDQSAKTAEDRGGFFIRKSTMI
jgi:calcium-dependent protein kinase